MNSSRSGGTTEVDTSYTLESPEKFERLKNLLREMFQLDRGDLDFGLYRIMKMKAAEIEIFLDRDLLPQVKAELSGIADDDRMALEAGLAEAKESARRLGVDPEEAPRVVELNKQLATAKADADAESDVYNHLAIFFERYYAEGDFISLRRYSSGGRSSYLLPYDGEEVKLHWANADQYYVKTTENYTSYVFTAGDGHAACRVWFEIAAADNEKDNIKEASEKQRRFVLANDEAWIAINDRELVVQFEHRPLSDTEKKIWPGNGSKQQDRVNEASVARIQTALKKLAPKFLTSLVAPAPSGANPNRTVLAKHIERYTARNSFDYFIHKDLSGFLCRELDLYLKNEVLNLDDLSLGDPNRLRRALARMRAVRHVAEKIIAFLAQLEDFQKHLWLKKKFILETQWCVTLDRVPEALYPEITANEAQRKEWIDLYAIDEIVNELGNGGATYSEPLSTAFLKANPYLVLDTRYFSVDFKDRLLGALSEDGSLEEQTDGLLVNGENFQALNLLQTRFIGQINCVYIDPPYNTGDSEILYKNGYLRSSWLSLMSNHFSVVHNILSTDAIFYIAIDDFEMVNLAKLVDSQCPWLRREMIIINHHPQGGKGKVLASTHEYMLACMPISSDKTLVGRQKNNEVEKRPFKRSGTAESNFRHGRPNSFYAVLVNPDSHEVVGLEPPPSGQYPTEPTENGLIRIYPIGAQGVERVWRKTFNSCKELVNSKKLICSKQRTIYQKIEFGERKAALFSNWVGPRYNAGTFGANLLSDIIGKQNPFPYPKSVYTVEDAIFAAGLNSGAFVLDYFAGSGTTGHAVIDLNREDGDKRKYILVEMAHYFDTVLLPRVKKVVYAPDWTDGKPVSRSKGVTQLIKYVRLESYEDTLDGLVLTQPGNDLLADSDPALTEDYRLRYALGAETIDSSCLLGQDFTDPFAYTLSVVRDGIRREVSADLPETFNYLLGLRVDSIRRLNGVLTIAGTDAQGLNCLIIWRNLNEMDNKALENWFVNNRSRFSESLDLVYVNGDHTLNAIRKPGETWTGETIEPIFRKLMFEPGKR